MKIGRFYQACISVILVLVILYLLSRLEFLYRPVMLAFNILLLPFVVSFFFYYLFRPLVTQLHRWKMPKWLAVIVLFIFLFTVVALLVVLVWPTLQSQTVAFVENLPALATEVQNQLTFLQNQSFGGFSLQEIDFSSKVSEYLEQAINYASVYLENAVSIVTTLALVVGTVPVLLYYMLKEDRKGYTSFVRFSPVKYRADAIEIFNSIDKMLSEFVIGRVVCCLALGAFAYVGFLIVDLPYSLMLAIFVGAMNMIPYIGSIIGSIPCVLIAFTDSFTTAVWVLVIILLAQQLEGNLISPFVYGRTMDIHPLTTIVVVLVAGAVSGIVGIMISIPVYMICKIVILQIAEHFERKSMPDGAT
ncbi:AI-2E family transporter [Paenibacillus pasadenensis]|uniref:AI-2E family transporter n=1 Tax=Paenibacillus pasadenensis TaxID=217090 RepID=UPI00203CD510|nr:AI-2E family transporter [Paenibacillus pasadenensis]MCM3747173.1 AI-2E family transporter [Paenibacillus pasadenensis]